MVARMGIVGLPVTLCEPCPTLFFCSARFTVDCVLPKRRPSDGAGGDVEESSQTPFDVVWPVRLALLALLNCQELAAPARLMAAFVFLCANAM
jgi:hypothetical protein